MLQLIQDLGTMYPTEKSKEKKRFGIYKCECGKEFKAQTMNIKNNRTRSCGCIKNKDKITHGMEGTRIYIIWSHIIQRTSNKNFKQFKDYGGRGITVCDRWKDFNNFYEDMKDGYNDSLSIDRINVDGNYEKSNCRWTTREIQNRNTRLLRVDNTSGYRGVSFYKVNKKYSTKISVNNKRIFLGYFDTPIEAAKAYDNYVIENNLEHTRNF